MLWAIWHILILCKQQLRQISKELTNEFGKGFSVSNIQFMRRFYQAYQIQQTVSVKLSWSDGRSSRAA
ncbi:DUF1016 family protein [Clostridiaceae bacterium]|nr:DUF1016 family protein [Clostridiaceae bacterium]